MPSAPPRSSTPSAPPRSSPEVAFVLPGGGSAGASQIGILRSLLEAGIRPDVLVGCSVGALNAAFFAMDPTLAHIEQMERLWLGLTRDRVFGTGRPGVVARMLAHRDHLWSPGPLRALIAANCPIDDLADLAIPVEVVTTDIDNAVARWWRCGPAAEILYATACLPGLLPPAMLDGHRHVDGGVLERAPVQRGVDLDASTVYVLGDIIGPDDEPALHLSALDVLVRSFSVSRYARLPDPVGLARAGQRVIVVPGANTAGVPVTDFSQTPRFLTEGRERSRRFLSSIGLPPSLLRAGRAEMAGST
jgi:NTE family protein